MALPARALFIIETTLFGDNAVGYHLVNLALLYGCMLCVYFLVKHTVRGPLWLGTLAGVLFMANPVHAESTLNLCGVSDIVPCLLALGALLAYALYRELPRRGGKTTTLVAFTVAVLTCKENAGLFLALALYEILIVRVENRSPKKLIPFAAVAVAGWLLHAKALFLDGPGLVAGLPPLYFLWYPIGFLPETARNFHESAWLGWAAGLGTCFVLTLIYGKARRPTLLFGLLGMVAVRLFQGDRPVDPVHMVGGGQLLLANALFVIALVALFLRMMDHPKWRITIVSGTTSLCIIFFAMHIRANYAWRHASDLVREFQTIAAKADDATFGICPDYQYFRGAPLCLSESIKYDTAFSTALDAPVLLPLHYAEKGLKVDVHDWAPQQGKLTVTGARPLDLACWPYNLSRTGGKATFDGANAEVLQTTENSITLALTPTGAALPAKPIPASLAWPEPSEIAEADTAGEEPHAQ